MNKFFILDAYALIFRSYYAFIKNPRINSKGLNTSAIMGFCNTLNEVLNKEQPSHICVAFDPHGPTFRSEAFPQYKAQRDETPEDIRLSIPYIKSILEAYNIQIAEVEGFEADDVIGTLAMKSSKTDTLTYIITPDKDYGQLVGDKVFIYRPRHGGGYEIMGIKEVCDKYAIENTSQVIDLLGLMGDSADNFPGCPGVGEKTASKLIKQFGNIENLLAHTDQIKGALKTKIESHTDDIKMSKFLATIRTDVPIDFNLDNFKRTEPDEEKLAKIFGELELRNLASRIIKGHNNTNNDFKQNANKSQKTKNFVSNQLDLFADFTPNEQENHNYSQNLSIKDTTHSYKLVDNENDMRKLRELLLTTKIFSLDTETTSTDAHSAELVGLSFSVKEFEAFYVPIPKDRDSAQRVVNIFKDSYENEDIEKVGQNIKYDIIVLRRYGIDVRGRLFDTMIAHYLLQPELHHNMDYMAATLLNYDTIKIEQLIGSRGKNQKSMRDVDISLVSDYAAEDADVTLRLKNTLEQKLKSNAELYKLFTDIEMPLVRILVDMEYNGVRIDTSSLAETSKTLNQRLQNMEQQIYSLAGQTFNIASPRQVGEILFNKLKIVEKAKKTKTGQYVTSEEVLQQLRSKHEIVEAILDHRGLKKLLTTYIDVLPKLINPTTHHIHTSFNQTATATGRLSSSDPNLQNIPIRGDEGKEIRRAFIPDEGNLFFSADYSQIELRVMAHLSGDENMIKAFIDGHDIHAATAAHIYRKDVNDVSRDERTKAKRANFGIIYGITVFGLAERLNISRVEAKDLIDGYFQSFPKVHEFMQQSIETARTNGYAETLFHRRRYLPDINSGNATVRGFAERNAINAPIQGTAADIIKVAMIRIHKRFKEEGIKSKMILQVHDELNFSVVPEERDRVEAIVIGEMQNAFQLKVPLIADSGWGNNWLEAH